MPFFADDRARRPFRGPRWRNSSPTTALPRAREKTLSRLSRRRWARQATCSIDEAVGFFDESDEAWQRLFETNILSGLRLSRHYLKGMLERKSGRVVFIASEAAISPSPEMAHYSATKTIQLSISRSLAELTKGTACSTSTR